MDKNISNLTESIPQNAAPPDTPDSRPKMGRDSTGPKLLDGKARCSQNAVKHGLWARNVVVIEGHARENPAEFDQLLSETREMYQPEGPVQNSLVQHIALCTWWLWRSQRFEIAAIVDNAKSCRRTAQHDTADAMAAHQEQIVEARRQIGEAQTFLRYLRDHPESDPFDFDLTFDVVPMMDAIAQLHGRTSPSLLMEENDADRYKQFLLELGIMGQAAIRAAVIAGLQRVIERETERAAQLEAEALDPPDLETASLLGALPAPDRLKLLIRYRTMVTRDRDRTVDELNRLKLNEE